MSELKSNEKQYTFTQNILRCSDHLKSYARHLTQQPEDAEDLYQETIYRSLYYAHNYKEEGYMEAWLKTIMRNTHINYLSISKHNDTRLVDNIESIPEAEPDEVTYEANDLYRAMERLPHNELQIVTMRIQGYSSKDISEALHMNIGTVKSTINRIKRKLKLLLNE